MPTKDDGGPLFVRSGDKEVCRLTVRDYFAGMAIVGLLFRQDAYPYYDIDDDDCGSETARTAFLVADKMLAERNKQDPTSPLWDENRKDA